MTRPLPKVSDPALRKKVKSLPSIAPVAPGAVPAAMSGTAASSEVVLDDAVRLRKREP